MQSKNLKLYSTEHCHLCEEAIEILQKAGITATIIDIVDDDTHFEKFSTRIPVLQRPDNHDELDWPFNVKSVLKFLL